MSFPIFAKYWLNNFAFNPSSSISESLWSFKGPILLEYCLPLTLLTVFQNWRELFAFANWSFQYWVSADLSSFAKQQTSCTSLPHFNLFHLSIYGLQQTSGSLNSCWFLCNLRSQKVMVNNSYTLMFSIKNKIVIANNSIVINNKVIVSDRIAYYCIYCYRTKISQIAKQGPCLLSWCPTITILIKLELDRWI